MISKINLKLAMVEDSQAFAYRQVLGGCDAREDLEAEDRAWVYRCKQIGSNVRAQQLLRQGHTYLDSNGDGKACDALR